MIFMVILYNNFVLKLLTVLCCYIIYICIIIYVRYRFFRYQIPFILLNAKKRGANSTLLHIRITPLLYSKVSFYFTKTMVASNCSPL